MPLLVILLDPHVANEVGSVGNARAVPPHSVDHVSTFGGPTVRLERYHPMGSAEVTVSAEEFPLRKLRPVRCDKPARHRPKCEAPTDARIAASDLKHHSIESDEIVFVTAEQLRLEDPVEARLAELHLHGCQNGSRAHRRRSAHRAASAEKRLPFDEAFQGSRPARGQAEGIARSARASSGHHNLPDPDAPRRVIHGTRNQCMGGTKRHVSALAENIGPRTPKSTCGSPILKGCSV